MKTRSIPLLAELLRNALKAIGVTPVEVAARVFPKPKRGRDRRGAERSSFAEQLTRLVGPKPRPADCVTSPRLAMALDRVLGLPNAFCLLVGALDNATNTIKVHSEFLTKITPLDRPKPEPACSYVVVVQFGPGRARAFVDGRLAPGSSSFPAEP